MSSILALRDYGDGSDSSSPEENVEALTSHLHVPVRATAGDMVVCAAPAVMANDSLDDRRHISVDTKTLMYNPRYDELYAPLLGPRDSRRTQQQLAQRNTLAGYAEPAHFSHFQFENQRRTFSSYGYAADPSTEACVDTGSGNQDGGGTRLVGADGVSLPTGESDATTVFEKTGDSRPSDKRRRVRNSDAADVDGYMGPWGGFIDEQRVMKPSDEEQAELDIIVAKRQKRGKQVDTRPMEEKTVLHIKDAYDYQGRSYLHTPQDVGVNLRSETPPEKCFIPKKKVHTWQGHSKGVHAVRWFPKSAHLILSCGMDNKLKLWEVYNQRRMLRTYLGHRQAVRDVCFSNDGSRFVSASYDRYLKLWDTETGECVGRFTNKKVPYCVKFNPDDDKQHLFVGGLSDKKIVCWDTRSDEIIQEYDRHLGSVNTITFIDENRRFVSTSDDKSVRVWEWDIPVDMKYIADPSMHSMPAVTLSPNGKWLACQSMDNKICMFSALNRYSFHRKKVFTGHMVAGYACGVDFSPEMSYLISGDADGKCCVWDWKSTKLLKKWQAHDGVCIQAMWHPHETSKVVTAGWDGAIHLWD